MADTVDIYQDYIDRYGLVLEARSIPERPDASMHTPGLWTEYHPHFDVKISTRSGSAFFAGYFTVSVFTLRDWADKHYVPYHALSDSDKFTTQWGTKYPPHIDKVLLGAKIAYGEAVQSDPDLLGLSTVLYCVREDAEALSQSFDDWCCYTGCYNDSRRAYTLYQGCRETAHTIIHAVGVDGFADFMRLVDE